MLERKNGWLVTANLSDNEKEAVTQICEILVGFSIKDAEEILQDVAKNLHEAAVIQRPF